MFTVTLTISFVILMYNILDISPVVFLKLAQDQVGESDFVFTKTPGFNISEGADVNMYSLPAFDKRKPRPVISSPFINFTQIDHKIEK